MQIQMVRAGSDQALIFPPSKTRTLAVFDEKDPLGSLYLSEGEFDPNLPHLKGTSAPSSAELWERYRDADAHIESDRELIRATVDRTYQIFFFMLICCYDTPYHFEWKEASDQLGKGTKSTYITSPDGKKKAKIETQAAHSAIFPCLMACPKAEWDLYQRTGRDKPQESVYLRNSRLGIASNTTVELPIKVNQSDTERDGTHANSQLRNELITLVNQVAQKQLSVQEAMRQFSYHFFAQVTEKRDKPGQNPLKQKVFEIYRERSAEIDLADEGTFDDILSIRIEDSADEDSLREVVYSRRFRLIQALQKIENGAAKVLLDGHKLMLGKECPSLAKLDSHLRFSILDQCAHIYLPRLETLLCTSLDQLRSDLNRPGANLRNGRVVRELEEFGRDHRASIAATLRALYPLFEQETRKVLEYRGQLFKGLREEYKGWKIREFVAAYKKLYPADSMSPAMVSRITQCTREARKAVYLTPIGQRSKWLSEWKASRVAAAFGVDDGVFKHAL